MIKQLGPLALLLVVLVPFAIKISGQPNFVKDHSKALSYRTRRQLNHALRDLSDQKDVRLQIVVVRNLHRLKIEQVANVFERKLKLKSDGTDRWILMLVSTQERQATIEVSDSLSGVIPQQRRIQILTKFMLPYFQNMQLEKMVTGGTVQIVNSVAPGFPIQKYFKPGEFTIYASAGQFSFWALLLIVFLFVGRSGYWRFLFGPQSESSFRLAGTNGQAQKSNGKVITGRWG